MKTASARPIGITPVTGRAPLAADNLDTCAGGRLTRRSKPRRASQGTLDSLNRYSFALALLRGAGGACLLAPSVARNHSNIAKRTVSDAYIERELSVQEPWVF